MNPSSQKCSAIEPTVSDVTVVLPFAGVPGFPQKIAVNFFEYIYSYALYKFYNGIHLHIGLSGLQNAPPGVNSHICVLFPASSKPSLQVYVTTLPSLVSVKLLFPLSGAPGSPHSTRKT